MRRDQTETTMITRRNALTYTATGLVLAGLQGILPFGLSGAARAQEGEIEDISLGEADAPVQVVEYASFTCPHCASFHNDTFKAFKRDYIDTGKAHFTYREVYFDRYGLWASMIARCAGPERYFGVSDLLYSTQSDWARQGDPADVAASLKRIGAQAGLSSDEADACLQDADKAQALVNWYEENVAADNIRSTPSFLVNGALHAGNMSLEQIASLVEEAS